MTWAEFKRHAARGEVSLELLDWFGKTGEEIPVNMRGPRKVVRTAYYGLVLLNHDGEESDLRFLSAKLVDCSAEFLTVYQMGTRELTEKERNFLEEWSRVKAEFEQKCPWGDLYSKKKSFFDGSMYPYLSGFSTHSGKRYDVAAGKVIDSQVRGDVIMRYRVYMA